MNIPDIEQQSYLKPPNMGLISWTMFRHKLSLSESLFVGLPEKHDSPVSALATAAGIDFMKADVFFGKSLWNISSKMYATRFMLN